MTEPPARGSACSASCRSSTTTCSPASPSARPATRASSATALGGVADVGSRRPRADRADIERVVRELRARGPRRRARGHAHLRARHARRPRAVARRGCRSAWPTSSRSPTSRRLGHGRPDLQPGHPRRAGHRERDGARRPAVPRAHRRLAGRLVPRRGGAVGARGAAVTALAHAEGRRLRLRDERAWATSAWTRTRCCARSGRRSTSSRRATCRAAWRPCRRRRRRDADRRGGRALRDRPAAVRRGARGPRADAARASRRSCATRGYAPTPRTSTRSPRTAASRGCRWPPRRR